MSSENGTLGSIEEGIIQNDPLNLKSFIKTDSDINKKSKNVKAFYRKQNKLIFTLLEQDVAVNDDGLQVKIAIYGSAVANFFLVILQLSAAISSGSLAILATAADAIMDLASSIVIIISNRAAAGGKVLKYPTGKARMETAGNVFSFNCRSGGVFYTNGNCFYSSSD
jgi:hypothetical protein